MEMLRYLCLLLWCCHVTAYPFYVMFNAKSTVSTSIDNGKSWYHVNSNACYRIRDVKCFAPQDCYAINSATNQCNKADDKAGVFTTSNGFKDYLHYQFHSQGMDLRAMDCWNKQICVITGSYAQKGLVFRTISGWRSSPSLIDVEQDKTLLSVSVMDGGYGVIVGRGTILLTKDYGKTWKSLYFLHLTQNSDFRHVSCFAGTCVIVGGNELILHSTDSGQSWRGSSITYGALCKDHKCPDMSVHFERVSCASSRFCVIVAQEIHPSIPGGFCWTFNSGYSWKCHKETVYKDFHNQFYSFYDIHCGAEGNCVSTINNPPRGLALLHWTTQERATVDVVTNIQVPILTKGEGYYIDGTRPSTNTFRISAGNFPNQKGSIFFTLLINSLAILLFIL